MILGRTQFLKKPDRFTQIDRACPPTGSPELVCIVRDPVKGWQPVDPREVEVAFAADSGLIMGALKSE
jgi:hypothetical protein